MHAVCPVCRQRPIDPGASHWLVQLPLLPWLYDGVFRSTCSDCAGARNLLAIAAWVVLAVVAIVLVVILS